MLGSWWRLCSVALLAGPCLLLSSCGKSPAAGGGKRFIFLINNPDPFWDACRAGLVEGAKKFELEQSGLSVAMEANDGTAQGQIDRLRQYASQSDIVGVAISVIQADNVA